MFAAMVLHKHYKNYNSHHHASNNNHINNNNINNNHINNNNININRSLNSKEVSLNNF